MSWSNPPPIDEIKGQLVWMCAKCILWCFGRTCGGRQDSPCGRSLCRWTEAVAVWRVTQDLNVVRREFAEVEEPK